MREKLQRLWDSSGRWFLLGLPLAAVILGLVIWQANQAVQPPRETIADPPTETEVTFDLEKNRAYTAEDGVVVIRPSGQEDSAESKAVQCPGDHRRPGGGLGRGLPFGGELHPSR